MEIAALSSNNSRRRIDAEPSCATGSRPEFGERLRMARGSVQVVARQVCKTEVLKVTIPRAAAMFFILSHIFGVLAIPSNLVVLIGIAGVVLLPTRFFVAGRKLLVVSFLLIIAIGILPIGTALTLPLESRFPPWNAGKGTPTGIVVLGG